MPVAIFLSHSTRDDATVAALRIALESHGVSVWADSQRLSAGEELTPSIQEAIASARHFVVLPSPRAINSPWVHKEVQLAQTVALGWKPRSLQRCLNRGCPSPVPRPV